MPTEVDMSGVWDPAFTGEAPICNDPCSLASSHQTGEEGCDFIWTYEDGVKANPSRNPTGEQHGQAEA